LRLFELTFRTCTWSPVARALVCCVTFAIPRGRTTPMSRSDDDDDDAFAVCLHNGLVDGTEGACCTDFAVWDGLLPLRGEALTSFREEALLAAWPLAEGSFWLPASSTPVNALEALARRIYDFHLRDHARPSDLVIDPETSGCEWWANLTRSDLLRSGAGDIGFHFDKDEGSYSEFGLVVHPLLSTVTYLTAEGAPTILLPHLTLSEATAATAAYERSPHTAPPGSLAQEALAVPPRIGRHLCFDGRWLHGAPASMRPTTADGLESSYERVTFCVNVWINHKPRQLRRFEAGASASLMARHVNDGAAAADLGLRAASAQAARAKRQATVHTLRSTGAPESERHGGRHGNLLRFPLEQTDVLHELRLYAPPRLASMLRRGCVVRLRDGVDVGPADTADAVGLADSEAHAAPQSQTQVPDSKDDQTASGDLARARKRRKSYS